MADTEQSKPSYRGRMSALRLAVLLALLATAIDTVAAPGVAQAHGPIAPDATSYVARIGRVPVGVQAKVIDGYLRMWMRVGPTQTVVVLDYRGAPYLRFSPSGVYVNERSEMYFLNSVFPESPPAGLTRQTPPRWQRVSSGHEYGWHDARIGALADTAIPPGSTYVGRWQVAVLLDGRLSAVSGGLWHVPAPSLVWLWMIFVVIACVLAAWRLDRPELHARLARALAAVLLIAIAVGFAGRELHGRPYVSVEQFVIAIPVVAFAAWGLLRVLIRRVGWISDLITAFAAFWVGSELWPTLLHGFVLTAIPPLLARMAAVVCLGGSVGLLLLAIRKIVYADRAPAAVPAAVAALLLMLSGCGAGTQRAHTSSMRSSSASRAIPANLLRQARPIGRGPRFHPPPGGPIPSPCSPLLGARADVHVEVFAADRVVIVPAGIGVGSPWRMSAGRVSSARCYGALATLEPTGVVLVRRGVTLTLADLFRAWGEPLTCREIASFTAAAPAHGDDGTHCEAVVFVNGHRRHGAPGSVPLIPRAEIVIEIGPRVPPHSSYTFPSAP